MSTALIVAEVAAALVALAAAAWLFRHRRDRVDQ